ncbi:MAG: kinase [Rhodospirillaceae bacterium]|nr:kinase [Rhodospirillales bacterium]
MAHSILERKPAVDTKTSAPHRSPGFFTSRTPFRISFFGGGTDYPQWYRNEGGAVLSTSIDKYCYISGRWLPPFFPTSYRIVWSHIETVTSVSEILHPAVRHCLRMFDFADNPGLELHHQSDLPARTGVGSSSAFAVGLIRILTALRCETMDKSDLYLKAIELEQDWIKDAVGSQDQVATAVGGLNVIRFGHDGAISVQPVRITESRRRALESRLMMVYTGLSRAGPELAQRIIDNLPQRTANLHRMHAMVDEAAALLEGDGDLDDFGRMLDETWRLKRSLADQISNDRIDAIYAAAKQAGAIGGKLLGAGSSGFLLFYVRPEYQDSVRQATHPLLEVPFQFDTQGSVIMNSEWR